MRRINVFTAALAAGLVIPTIATAAEDVPPSTLTSRDGSPRVERQVREKPTRTGEEARFEGRDEDAGGRAAGEPGASALRDGTGEAAFDQLGGEGRGAEPVSAFRLSFDADEDRVLSPEERARLEKALVPYHRSLRQPIDTDRDGLLGDREWHAFLQSTYGEQAEWYVARDVRWSDARRHRHDVDGDGSLNEDEQLAFARALDQHRLFQLERFDRDGDAAVGEKELAFVRASQVVATLDNVGGTRFRATARRRAFGTGTATGAEAPAGAAAAGKKGRASSGDAKAIRSVRARGDRP